MKALEKIEIRLLSLFLPLFVALAAAWWPPPSLKASGPAPAGAARAPGGLEEVKRREEEGDRVRARAEPAYRRALEALDMAERFAARLNDPTALRRATLSRAALLALILDARSCESLEAAARSRSALAISPSAPALTVPAGAAAPGEARGPREEDLQAL